MSLENPVEGDEVYALPGQHWIQGTRFSVNVNRDSLSRVLDFPVHADDVFVCGYPKTGNHWVSLIVSAISHQDDLDTWIQQEHIETGPPITMIAEQAVDYPRPAVFFTHVLYHQLPTEARDKNVKIVHISRDPKDVAVSYYYFHRSLKMFGPYKGSWDLFYDNFISGQLLYGSYFNTVRSYWLQKDKPNIMLISYENLLRDPKACISKLAEFLGKTLTSEKLEKIIKITEFSNMKNTPTLTPDTAWRNENAGLLYMKPGTSYLRKGVIGDWRHLFTEDQRRQTDGLYRQRCEETGVDQSSH